MLSDLSTVDPQLYNNLMFLKITTVTPKISTLSFTVTVDNWRNPKSIDTEWTNIDVTNTNKQRYIERWPSTTW
jgi:ubiquitin-protein ligase E3 C